MLVANDAPLFVTNVAGQTPCDVAASAKHVVIAQLLESKMVFAVRMVGSCLRHSCHVHLYRSHGVPTDYLASFVTGEKK